MVALNTNLYYTSNKQVINESDPADQFQWLNMTLSRAEHNQEKVIINNSWSYKTYFMLNSNEHELLSAYKTKCWK